MLRAALVFLVLALVTGVLGVGGVIGAPSMSVAYGLFLVFLLLVTVSFITADLRRGGPRA
ncbi:DUF1328 family protein [Brevundimonas sp.]|jgi:uncharacterized membrane protein YtjA (UPF0391 family)|uniref:DUF1328 family protein n=1 Tax=Brevundimonas sp. TaxID=1871086 RepID=UPI001AD298FD|nr:DUF1328 domain-containing protein [Caulobacterales bacterium]